MENFEHVDLTEDEIAGALLKAREEKHYRMKREEYREKLTAEPRSIKLTAEEYWQGFKQWWQTDDDNAAIIQNICYYFSEDVKFKGNLEKGLLLVGGVGVGKSTLMEFFKKNQRSSYRMLSCREIESDFAMEGEKSVSYCSYDIPISTNSDPFGHQVIGICFDDLGTEANGKYFGKEKNLMAEIILNRYDNKLPFCRTHITTNLTAMQIKDQYGTRVTDRMREMFNIISFDPNAKSRRS